MRPLQVGVLYGNPEVTSGGVALKFYSSVRVEVRRKLTIEGAKGENIGIRVKAKVSLPLSALLWFGCSHPERGSFCSAACTCPMS